MGWSPHKQHLLTQLRAVYRKSMMNLQGTLERQYVEAIRVAHPVGL